MERRSEGSGEGEEKEGEGRGEGMGKEEEKEGRGDGRREPIFVSYQSSRRCKPSPNLIHNLRFLRDRAK